MKHTKAKASESQIKSSRKRQAYAQWRSDKRVRQTRCDECRRWWFTSERRTPHTKDTEKKR